MRYIITLLAVLFTFSAIAQPDRKQLKKIVENQDTVALEKLIAEGFDLEAKVFKGDANILFESLFNLRYDLSAWLVKKGADPNSLNNNHETPLLLSACHMKYNLMRYMIDHGGDVTIKGYQENTLLGILVGNSSVKDVDNEQIINQLDYILTLDTNINYKCPMFPEKPTYLMYALMIRSDDSIIKFLVYKGINVNEQDTKGCTALQYALQYGRKDLIPILLKAGANPDIKDKEGKSAREEAEIWGAEEYFD